MSNDFNQVILTGNVGQAVELVTLPDANVLAKLSLATNKRWKHEEKAYAKAEWHTVIFYGKLAELVNEYVAIGDKLLIKGELCYKKWQDKSGVNHTTAEIRVEEFNILHSNRGKLSDMHANESKEIAETALQASKNLLAA